MLRVLAFNRTYPPDTGATGQLLAELCEDLVVTHGWIVTVVAARPGITRGDGGRVTAAEDQETYQGWTLSRIRYEASEDTGGWENRELSDISGGGIRSPSIGADAAPPRLQSFLSAGRRRHRAAARGALRGPVGALRLGRHRGGGPAGRRLLASDRRTARTARRPRQGRDRAARLGHATLEGALRRPRRELSHLLRLGVARRDPAHAAGRGHEPHRSADPRSRGAGLGAAVGRAVRLPVPGHLPGGRDLARGLPERPGEPRARPGEPAPPAAGDRRRRHRRDHGRAPRRQGRGPGPDHRHPQLGGRGDARAGAEEERVRPGARAGRSVRRPPLREPRAEPGARAPGDGGGGAAGPA